MNMVSNLMRLKYCVPLLSQGSEDDKKIEKILSEDDKHRRSGTS